MSFIFTAPNEFRTHFFRHLSITTLQSPPILQPGESGYACNQIPYHGTVEAPDVAGKTEARGSKEIMEAEANVLVGDLRVVLSSGKGCKLYDLEGQEYLDLTSGISVNALGHCDSDWLMALIDQANLLTHISNVSVTLFLSRVFFCNSGTEGTRLLSSSPGSSRDILTVMLKSQQLNSFPSATVSMEGRFVHWLSRVKNIIELPLNLSCLELSSWSLETLKAPRR